MTEFPIICKSIPLFADQINGWTGFYMIEMSVMKELKAFLIELALALILKKYECYENSSIY